MKNYPYNGYDWSEIPVCLNIPHMDENPIYDFELADNEERVAWLLDNETLYITCYVEAVLTNTNYHFGGKSFVLRWLAKQIRNYLKRLEQQSKDIDYNAPLWEGLQKIESDLVLVHYFKILVGSAWS